MNKYLSISLIAILTVAACGTEEAPQSWETFAATTVAEYYARNPETAVYAGLHEYDGQMDGLVATASNGPNFPSPLFGL